MISKDTFVKVINYIVYMDNFAENLNQVFKDYDRHDWILGYAFNDEKFQSMVLNLLSEAIGDSNDWIHWWAYETNFGQDEYLRKIFEKGKEGKVVYDLSSPEELYDFLIDNCGK